MRLARTWTMLVVALLVVLASCQPMGSEQYATNTMVATVVFSADASAREVMAEATVSMNNEWLTLMGEDYLTARGGGEARVLLPVMDDYGPTGRYSVTFQQDGDGVIFETAFNRKNGQSALSSTVIMPDAFDVDDVNDEPSRANGFSLGWSSVSEDPMYVALDSMGCLSEAQEFEVADPNSGRVFIDASRLVVDDDIIVGEVCVVSVTISRRVQGELDAAYLSGSVMAQTVVAFNVATRP